MGQNWIKNLMLYLNSFTDESAGKGRQEFHLNGEFPDRNLSINCFTEYIHLKNSNNWFDNLLADSTEKVKGSLVSEPFFMPFCVYILYSLTGSGHQRFEV